MKLIVIPPYRNPAVDWVPILRGIMARPGKKSQFEGDEVDIDEGPALESPSAVRDAEFLANVSLALIRRIKQYSGMGKYDAIVSTGFLDPGFEAARTLCKIPVTGGVHSSLVVASLIGRRTSIVIGKIPIALMVRQIAESYGFGHKLASVRAYGHSTTELCQLVLKHKDRLWDTSEAGKATDDIVAQCIVAIEKDRADSIILGCEPSEYWEDEIRQKLDKAGYDEIPLIGPFQAALQMAKAMVNMRLTQTARAYPTDSLRAQQEYA